MNRTRHFASDNYSGVCPEAWAAMADANRDHEVSYGDDHWTQRASDAIRGVFETAPPPIRCRSRPSASPITVSSPTTSPTLKPPNAVRPNSFPTAAKS